MRKARTGFNASILGIGLALAARPAFGEHHAEQRHLVTGELATSVSSDVVQSEVGMWLHVFGRRNANALGMAIADRYVIGDESSVSLEAMLGFRLATLHPFEGSIFGGIEREISPRAGMCLTGVAQLTTSHRLAPAAMPSVIYCSSSLSHAAERWRVDIPLGLALGLTERIHLLAMYQLTYLQASHETESEAVSHLTHGPRAVFVLDIP